MEFKKIKNKNLRFLLVGVIVIFMLGNFVSAFAVGFESTELRLYPGQVHDSAFSLQNYGTDVNDITVEAVTEEGEDYITFTEGARFDVRANTNVAAPVRISIPENARVGDNYPIKVLFRVISGDAGGNEAGEGTSVSFAFSYSRTINLVVVQRPEEKPAAAAERASVFSNIWFWIIIIIIVIIILWLVTKAKKK